MSIVDSKGALIPGSNLRVLIPAMLLIEEQGLLGCSADNGGISWDDSLCCIWIFGGKKGI